MSPATKQDSRAWAKLLRSSRKLLHPNSLPGRAALVLVAIAFVIIGSRGLWKLVRSHVETRPEYQAAADNIEITPLPSWIHSDVKSEVIRDAGLPVAMSILDERTIDRLKQAFSLHPWVAHVEGIDRSYPAHFKVDLTYRRPVAMVEVRGGLLPVDANAILLPTGDFSSAEAENYLRVSGSTSSPLGPVGTAWGDPTIEAAAKLADLLQPASNDWLLQRIRIQSQIAGQWSPNPRSEIGHSLRNGTHLGQRAGTETPPEPKADEKVARLRQLSQQGSLDAVPGRTSRFAPSHGCRPGGIAQRATQAVTRTQIATAAAQPGGDAQPKSAPAELLAALQPSRPEPLRRCAQPPIRSAPRSLRSHCRFVFALPRGVIPLAWNFPPGVSDNYFMCCVPVETLTGRRSGNSFCAPAMRASIALLSRKLQRRFRRGIAAIRSL